MAKRIERVNKSVKEVLEDLVEGHREAAIAGPAGAAKYLARTLEVDPEDSLRFTNAKFVRRFQYVEARLAERGRTPEQSDLAEMDALWDEAKAAERASSGS